MTFNSWVRIGVAAAEDGVFITEEEHPIENATDRASVMTVCSFISKSPIASSYSGFLLSTRCSHVFLPDGRLRLSALCGGILRRSRVLVYRRMRHRPIYLIMRVAISSG